MENEIIGKKVQYFFDSKTSVHIKLKENDRFKNGSIKYVGADFLLLQEINREGKLERGPESPIFFLEIKEIDAYKKMEEAE